MMFCNTIIRSKLYTTVRCNINCPCTLNNRYTISFSRFVRLMCDVRANKSSKFYDVLKHFRHVAIIFLFSEQDKYLLVVLLPKLC